METMSEKSVSKIRAVVTGASGMVGEGILHECLKSDEVEKVLVVGRRSCGVTHPKLTEIVHKDFFDLAPIEDQLKDWNACFFCLGMSSVGMSNEEYERMTHDLTLNFAETLAQVNENEKFTFCYVSGSGTDATETSRLHWARVKGRTENDLRKLFGDGFYAFRIGFVKPGAGAKNTLTPYKFIGWLYPLVRAVSANFASTLEEVGRAMIHCARGRGGAKQTLEVADINELARKEISAS